MATTVKVDFYTVTMPKGSRPFERAVADDAATPYDDTRAIDIRGFPVRLQAATLSGHHTEAEMLRIQMFDIPPKATKGGRVLSLGLKPNEGIGGETAFLYDSATKVLAVQRNRHGVSAKTIAEYFSQKCCGGSLVELTPLLELAAMTRLMRMKETRKVRVRFAGITNPDFFKGTDAGIENMIETMEHFRAPSAAFEISMGHEPGSLFKTAVVSAGRFISRLFGTPSDAGSISSMVVSGVLEDDTRDQFDLLRYRMVEEIAIQEGPYRRTTYESRKDVVKKAWKAREEEIKAMHKDST